MDIVSRTMAYKLKLRNENRPRTNRLHSFSNMSCAENRQIRCSMCSSMEKSTYYLCKSGRHVICENCQITGSEKNPVDDGDYIPEKECVAINKKESSCVHNSAIRLQDLASGDHIDTVTNCHTTKTKKEFNKGNSLKTSTPKHTHSKHSDMTVVFKNEQFEGTKSSVTSTALSTSNNMCKKEHNCGRVPRPIACPVTHCSRMVTIDSMAQHYNFDHSKVPRMILNKTGPQEICLNYSSLSAETKCIASFIISQKRPHTAVNTELSTNIHSLSKDNQLLLLMAAKIPTTSVKLSNTKFILRFATRNSYTQTEDKHSQHNQCHKLCASKSSIENAICTKKFHSDDDDEVTLIWLCKLDDKNSIYTVMLSGEDKKQAYSYIGDAINIRNEHDPFSIYNEAQCLALRKTAINKLLTNSKDLKVTISTVSYK